MDMSSPLELRYNEKESDIILYHGYHEYSMPQLINWYQTRIPDCQMLSITRDPVKRFISEVYYYHKPQMQGMVGGAQLIRDHAQKKNYSSVCNWLGMNTWDRAHKYMHDALKTFELLILHRFAESLVAMAMKFKWDLQDVLYVPINVGCKSDGTGGTRWDGKPVECPPKIEDLPVDLIILIKRMGFHDGVLYRRANRKLDTFIKYNEEEFVGLLKIFKRKLRILKEKCSSVGQAEPLWNIPRKPLPPIEQWSPEDDKMYCSLYKIESDLEYEDAIKHLHRTKN